MRPVIRGFSFAQDPLLFCNFFFGKGYMKPPFRDHPSPLFVDMIDGIHLRFFFPAIRNRNSPKFFLHLLHNDRGLIDLGGRVTPLVLETIQNNIDLRIIDCQLYRVFGWHAGQKLENQSSSEFWNPSFGAHHRIGP
jgi:hypothetical protein